jgi:hypothetical protein
MSTSPYQAGQVVQGSVVQPSAMAGPVASAVYGLGEILKDLIHNGKAYHSECQVLNAVNVVEDFVSAFVKPSEEPALRTGDERAPYEDVSLRQPPPGFVGMAVPNQPTIDYDKLAAALVRAQMSISPAPPVVPTQAEALPSDN